MTNMLVTNYEFIDHGLQHSDYFQGCGVALTNYNYCFTGTGDTPEAAAHDALDQACHDYHWDVVIFDEAEADASDNFSYDHAALSTNTEVQYFVSIRILLAE